MDVQSLNILKNLSPEDLPHRGGCFGTPLRAISRFSHQNAQTPPSPLWEKGAGGDEGQKRTGMQNIAHLTQKLYT